MTVTDFTANPPAYMEQHHLRYRGGGPSTQGGTKAKFGLVPIDKACRYRTGSVFLGAGNKKEDGACEHVRWQGANHHELANPGVGYFDAWWSGYKGGLAIHCDLPSAGGPDIMLTPELTGCTVVWVVKGDGSARFSHYNLKDGGGKLTLDDTSMIARAREDYDDNANMGSLSKGYYYGLAKHEQPSGGYAATGSILGWRQGGRWSFWAQFIEDKNGVSQIRKVQELPAGQNLEA
jgi:hypothetical protein